MGTGYILNFNVTSPAAATNFSISSQPFDVDGRPIKANVAAKTAGDITKNSRFSICLDLRDENTDDIITDIAWRVSYTCSLQDIMCRIQNGIVIFPTESKVRNNIGGKSMLCENTEKQLLPCSSAIELKYLLSLKKCNITI